MSVVVDPKDALFWFGTSDAMPTDQYFVLGFEAGDRAPTWQDVVEHIDRRSADVPALNKHLVESPAGIDYPRWVHGRAPVTDCVVPLCDPGATWATCVLRIEELLGSTVDATATPWQLHVANDVVGVPEVEGRATVVFARFSHVLTDGLGGAALLRALFGRTPRAEDVRVAADAEATPSGPIVWRVLDAARALGRLVQLPVALIATAMAGRRVAAHDVSPRGVIPRTSVNRCGAGVRHIAVLPIPAAVIDSTRYTVTQLALGAVSLATERLMIQRGETTVPLTAAVPVALREVAEWVGDNRFAAVVVGLGAARSDMMDRVETIRSGLTAERNRVARADSIRMMRLVESVPWPILSRYLRRGRGLPAAESVPAHMSVTSVNCGDGDMELAGGQAVMVAGFPCLSPDIGIGIGVYGIGDTVTLGVLTSPDAVPDGDSYVRLLESALDEIARAAV